jgi:hypothetical protein
VDNQDDCNDLDASQYPGAIWLADNDGDGFGDSSNSKESCAPEDGYIGEGGDCDDTDAAVNPNAAEDCNTAWDDNCDDVFNEKDAAGCTIFYADGDADGFAGVDDFACYCEATAPYDQTDPDDCDDEDELINPGAEEICGNGIDDNCDDSADGCGLVRAQTLSESDLYFEGTTDARVGHRLSFDHDVTGDGQPDLLTSGRDVSDFSLISGADMSGSLTFTLPGDGEVDPLAYGKSIASGDLDGDDQADVVLGAPRVSFGGRLFGGTAALYWGPISEDTEIAEPDIEVWGPSSDAYLGRAVWIGDLNGDAQDDLLVGAHEARKSGAHVGMVAIVFGPIDRSGASVIDTAIEDDMDVRIYGQQNNGKFGTSFADTFDWNGDGLPDLIVGARGANLGKGGLYVFGSGDGLSGDLLVEDADAAIIGQGNGSWTAESMVHAGDINGDGQDDLLVGAPNRNLLGEDRGAAYLLTDVADGNIIDLAELEIQGLVDDGRLGMSLSSSSDLDGLGPGIAVGAPEAGGGTVFLFAEELSGTLTTDDAVGQVSGAADDLNKDGVGAAVLANIDYNEDGVLDLIVGADSRGDGVGEIAVFFGGGI